MKNNTAKSGKRRFSLFGGKVSIHPLFLLVGAAQCFLGTLPSFLLAVVSALLHELAHAYAAASYGYRLNKIVLMPFGAMLDGEFSDLSAKYEIILSLAGPLCNFACAALFLALWWCFPSAYPYTESAFYASLSLGLCNLLPAYPLDGGRIAKQLLNFLFNKYLPPRKAEKRAKFFAALLSVLTALALIAVFLFTANSSEANWTIPVFCVFLLTGTFQKNDGAYERMGFSSYEAFSRGVNVRHIAVLESCTVKRALAFLRQGEYLVLEVYDENERFVGTITQNELSDFFLKTGLYAHLSAYF